MIPKAASRRGRLRSRIVAGLTDYRRTEKSHLGLYGRAKL